MRVPLFLSLLQRVLVSLCAVLITISISYAQAAKSPVRDTINADRPDQTESPHTVPKGCFQLEAGFFVNPFDSSGGRTPLIGMGVLRYGLLKHLELRLMAEDGRERDRYLEATTQGVFPLAAGAKVLLLERERGIVPQIALLGWMKLPFTSRSDEQRSYWSPQLMLAFENKVGELLEIEYNAGAKQEAYGHHWQGMGSVSVHATITDKFKIFAEYFAQYQPDKDPMQNIDFGLIWLVMPGLQLDASAGRSFSAPAEASNRFASIGCSVLF